MGVVPVIPALGMWKQVLEGHITKGREVDVRDQLGDWCYNLENIHKIFYHKLRTLSMKAEVE